MIKNFSAEFTEVLPKTGFNVRLAYQCASGTERNGIATVAFSNLFLEHFRIALNTDSGDFMNEDDRKFVINAGERALKRCASQLHEFNAQQHCKFLGKSAAKIIYTTYMQFTARERFLISLYGD